VRKEGWFEFRDSFTGPRLLFPSLNRVAQTTMRQFRVVHCVGFYFPENVGGTEVYVRDLADSLRPYSIESVIVAATDGAYREYAWEQTRVVRYPSDWATVCSKTTEQASAGLSKFQELIASLKPDILHLHSWTAGAGLEHLQQAFNLNIPSIVTMHVIGAICMRGTMLRDGKAPCDGRIDEKRCSYCWTLSRGCPSPIAYAISRLPKCDATHWKLPAVLRRMGTLLSIRSIISAKVKELQLMEALSERIVAPSEWVRAALLKNGIPPEKIFVSMQAASSIFGRSDSTNAERTAGAPLTIGYIGRLEAVKGIDTLTDALSLLPNNLSVRLLVAGAGSDPRYLRSLHQAAERDSRIRLIGPVAPLQVPQFLKSVDVVAVPSRWMETGPLVVHEAHAAGVPVLGADLGGISERIRHRVDGMLLPVDNPHAWASAIREILGDGQLLARLRANCGQARTTDNVASEMATLYRQALQSPPRPS
jgi:glycosyltransferase involved in cell wall biosynthesis